MKEIAVLVKYNELGKVVSMEPKNKAIGPITKSIVELVKISESEDTDKEMKNLMRHDSYKRCHGAMRQVR